MKKTIGILLIALSIYGCSNEASKIEVDNNKENKETPVMNDSYLDRFKKSIPDATIVGTTMFDIENDGDDDLIVIFDTPKNKSNFAVVDETNLNALTLNDDSSSFQFANGAESLKVLENPNQIVITLHKPTENLTVDFQVTYSYDEKEKKANFKIKSTNERND